MRVSVIVCDVCQEGPEGVSRWRVEGDGGKRSLDLCGTHSAPLKALLGTPGANGSQRASKRTSATPRKRAARTRVTTIGEIEASKKK